VGISIHDVTHATDGGEEVAVAALVIDHVEDITYCELKEILLTRIIMDRPEDVKDLIEDKEKNILCEVLRNEDLDATKAWIEQQHQKKEKKKECRATIENIAKVALKKHAPRLAAKKAAEQAKAKTHPKAKSNGKAQPKAKTAPVPPCRYAAPPTGGNVALVQSLAPPQCKIYTYHAKGYWIIEYRDFDPVHRSWTIRGRTQAMQEALNCAWSIHEGETGVAMPRSVKTKISNIQAD